MGTLTLTPVYIDYSSGSTWASLGANEAATKTVISNVCSAFSTALSCPSGNHTFNIEFGVNAVGGSIGDTTGTAVTSGASNFPNANFISTYSQYRTALLAIASPNSLQSTAWNSTNLPASNPCAQTTFSINEALGSAIGLNFTSVPDNTVVGRVGFHAADYTDLDANGLGTGNNLYEAIAHELSETIGRSDNTAMWWYSSAGVHEVGSAVARYISYDQGSTASKIYNLNATGSGDKFDADTSVQTAFHYVLLGGAVSRDSSTPLFAKDWLWMTLGGFGLTATGLSWAGLSTVPANTAVPTISGVLSVGHTLTTTNGSWTNSPTSFSYQWLRDNSNIIGETNSTFSLTSTDLGHQLSCAVTATNASGSSSPATSAQTSAIIAASRIKLRN